MTSTSTSLSLAIISIDSLTAALEKLGINTSVTALCDTVKEEEAGKRQNQIERLLATPARTYSEAHKPFIFAKPYAVIHDEESPEGKEEIRLLIEMTKKEPAHLFDQADSASQAADIEDLKC